MLEVENTLVIVDLLKITQIGYKEFKDVKPGIIGNLRKEKVKLKFGNLVSILTKDDISIDEEAILSLKTRYLPK